MKTIAVFNQKGGVAKSTTTINLGSCLAELGKKVLLIDMDPQANTTTGVGINDEELEHTIYDLLQGSKVNAIIHTDYGVDLIPSDITLTNAEITLANTLSRETILTKILKKMEYDYIIIDCPPSLGLLSINSLVAADSIIVPVSPSYFSIKGISHLLNTVNLVRDTLKPQLDILGVLVTNFDKRKNIADDIRTNLLNVFGNKVFKTIIRTNVTIEYAQENQMPINKYDRTCNGFEDYMKLAREVLTYEK